MNRRRFKLINISSSIFLPSYLTNQLPNENSLANLHSPSSFTQQASSSCPADLARIKQLQGLNLTSDEIKMIVRQKPEVKLVGEGFYVLSVNFID